MFWDAMLKFIPDSFCPQFGAKQVDPLKERDGVMNLRKNRTQSFSLRQPVGNFINKEGSNR